MAHLFPQTSCIAGCLTRRVSCHTPVLCFTDACRPTENYLEKREFSFTLPGDIYIRYISFAKAYDLRRELVAKLPVKIDIGAVYNMNPAEGRKSMLPMRPVERELVFDIDMTDYDEVRTCCKGADVCKKCWKFIAIACKILDRALADHFGFKHRLWVYSGRRGVHCWVCDDEARNMTVDERSAIVEYLSLVDAGKFVKKRCTLSRDAADHPLVKLAIEVIDAQVKHPSADTLFQEIVMFDQKLIETDKDWKRILTNLCNNKRLQAELMEVVEANRSLKPVPMFEKLASRCSAYRDSKHNHTGLYFIEELMLHFCYPRLDVNVSKGLNHLLKSPFVIHPKTGRICVPFDASRVDHFDPKTVPSISQLLDEMEQTGDVKGEKGCMAQCLKVMKQFVDSLEKDCVSDQQPDMTF